MSDNIVGYGDYKEVHTNSETGEVLWEFHKKIPIIDSGRTEVLKLNFPSPGEYQYFSVGTPPSNLFDKKFQYRVCRGCDEVFLRREDRDFYCIPCDIDNAEFDVCFMDDLW